MPAPTSDGLLARGSTIVTVVGLVLLACWAVVELGTRGKRPPRLLLAVGVPGLATVLVAGVALAAWNPSAVTSHATYTTPSLATPTNLTCRWTGDTAVQLDWTATASTWAAGHQIRRKTNNGSFSDYASTSPRATVTYTDSSATSPTSNSYTYAVEGSHTLWRSSDSNTVVSTSCINAISTVVQGANNAMLRAPEGVFVDSSGNVYIADTANHRIRKVDATTGYISTIAGTGVSGYSGDGGAATSAQLDNPQGVFVDGSGNVYIADSLNHRIRKITAATGIITTIAGTTAGYSGDGGTATSAQLQRPTSVVVDASNNVYIADRTNDRIRKITAATGIITTIAGTGVAGYSGDGGAATSAQVRAPEGIALDSSNNVFIADTANHRIRKITVATGIITTVAGTGTSGYSGDGGAATSAQLNSPTGVRVDSSNNIYIADASNKRVRKVTGTTIGTIAGDGTLNYYGDGYPATWSAVKYPHDMALDSNGRVYIADTNNDLVRKITSRGNLLNVAGNATAGFAGDGGPAATPGLVAVQAIAVDSSGNLYLSDYGDHRIRKWWASDGEVSTIAGTGTPGYTGDGGQAYEAKLDTPSGVALDSSNNVYIADTQNNRIRKITAATGVISTIAGSSGIDGFADGAATSTAKFYDPMDVAVASNGDVYIADTYNNRIRKLSGGNVTTVAGNASSGYNGDGSPATSYTLNLPTGIALDGSNNVFIADYGNYRIRKLAGTTISTVAGTGSSGSGGDGGAATSATFNLPFDVAVDGTTVYVADTYNHKVRKFTVGGNISTVVGTGTSGTSGDGGRALAAKIHTPKGVAVISGGDLFVSSSSTGTGTRKIEGPV